VSRLFDFSSMPTLVSERLVLREIRPDRDLAALFDLFADPAVALNTDTGPFTSVGEAEEVMGWITGIFESRHGLRWVIVDKADEDGLIGTCGFNSWQRHNSSAEIGYDLAQARWGEGLMTEALAPMLAFGFGRMGLNRVEADVTVGNVRSARVLLKLGFLEEGLLRQRGYWRDRYHDVRAFALLRDDWQAGSAG